MILILIFALIIRLFVAWNFFGPWDTESVYIVADLLKKGSLVYNETWRYSSPPVWMWMIGILSWISDNTGTPLYFWAKVPFILADLGIGILIFLIVRKALIRPDLKHGEKRSGFIGLFVSSFYLLNPLPILISSYQGQLDSLMIFLVMLAGWFFTRTLRPDLSEGRVLTLGLSALSLGMASTIKLVPLGLLPVFLWYLVKRVRHLSSVILFAILSLLPLILVFLPYLSVWDFVVEHVFRYKTWWSLWGFSLILKRLEEYWVSSPEWFNTIVTLSKNQSLSVLLVLGISYVVIFIKTRNISFKNVYTDNARACLGYTFSGWDVGKSILFVFLTEVALSFYLAPQYLIWILPFFLITLKKGRDLYLFLIFSLLTFLGASLLYAYWGDANRFLWLGQLMGKEVGVAVILVYSLIMIPAWLISLWWWKKLVMGKDPTFGR